MAENNNNATVRKMIFDQMKENREKVATLEKQITVLTVEIATMKWKFLLGAVLAGGLSGVGSSSGLKLLASAFTESKEFFAYLLTTIGG